ncbi:hypothetical protein pdam_00021961, partial [Pocillopora damicornis]
MQSRCRWCSRSGREKRRRTIVLKSVLELLPNPALKRVTVNFEKAIWIVLRKLLPNVEIQGSISQWSPSSWSVVMKSVRTNNDIDGWHLGLNRRASGKSQLPLYLLIRLLHREARRTSLQIRLISERKLRSVQKKKSSENPRPRSWDEFNSGAR